MRFGFLFAAAAALIVAGCGGGNPLRVKRSICPAPGVLQHADEVTLFSPPASRDANAIDVTAVITNLRAECAEDGEGDRIFSRVRFEVIAQRTNASGARQVTLPYFAVVVRAGDQLLSKTLDSVTLNFADGAIRAATQGTARASIDRASAVLPEDIHEEITRKRKPGDPDAAIDPLARKSVREAVISASFELLVGFQLDDSAVLYNIDK